LCVLCFFISFSSNLWDTPFS